MQKKKQKNTHILNLTYVKRVLVHMKTIKTMRSKQEIMNQNYYYPNYTLNEKEAATGGVLLKKGVLKNFEKFTEKHLCQGFFFNKVAVH